jgi:guanylate kinase
MLAFLCFCCLVYAAHNIAQNNSSVKLLFIIGEKKINVNVRSETREEQASERACARLEASLLLFFFNFYFVILPAS